MNHTWSKIPEDMFLRSVLQLAELYIPFSYRLSKSRALKEVGGAAGAEAQLLPWQHTSHLSLNFVRNIWGFDSIMLEVV